MDEERREDCGATAKQWARLGRVKRPGNWAHPSPLGTHPISKAAVTTRNSALCRRAQVMIAGQTLVTEKAAVGKPAESNPLPDLDDRKRAAQKQQRANLRRLDVGLKASALLAEPDRVHADANLVWRLWKYYRPACTPPSTRIFSPVTNVAFWR
jgi:hypothetical protein